LSIGSIVLRLRSICEKYEKAFRLPFQKSIGEEVKVPAKLRCGIARGRIKSIGAKQDYVGQCINIAARLQKLEACPSASGTGETVPFSLEDEEGLKTFSFAFWKMEFLELKPYCGDREEDFILIFPNVRGFREKEPVFVLRK